MPKPEPMPGFVGVLMALFSLISIGYWYLLLARPKTFVEWFLAKPYRAWGVTVTVTDEEKLRRVTRWLGLVLVMFAVGMALIGLGVSMAVRR